MRATWQGRHGHPVIFGRRVFDALRHADPAVGAKAVVHAHASDLIDLEVDDPGVLHDIDGPDDYARVFNQQSDGRSPLGRGDCRGEAPGRR